MNRAKRGWEAGHFQQRRRGGGYTNVISSNANGSEKWCCDCARRYKRMGESV